MARKEKNSKKNPIENANIFSRLCYWWLAHIWHKGANRDLEMKDLYDPSECERSHLLADRLEREWKKELEKGQASEATTKEKPMNRYRPSLLRCIIRIYFWSYTFHGFLTFLLNIVFQNSRVVFLGWLIMYFDPGSTISNSEAYCYATGIVVGTTLAMVTNNFVHFETARIGMQLRVACSSLIYRKILKLSKTSLDQTSAGKIFNLLGNDVQRFDVLPIHLHYMWVTPIQIFLITYLIWLEVGFAAFAGLAVMLLQTIPIQGYMSKLSVQLRRKVAEQTDKRVQLMSELISGIQVVKISFYMNGFMYSERVTISVTLITLVLTGNSINARIVFTVTAYWKSIQVLMAASIPIACVSAGDAYIAISRIREYLLTKELTPDSRDLSSNVNPTKNQTGIKISKLSANWVYGALPPTLNNLSLNVSEGQLCALVGPVGSGKSSVLQLILGELPVAAGTLDIGGQTVSYAAQEAWLFGGTIKDNILFGLPYVKSNYDVVIKVCALDKDFEQLPNGHLTCVGDRGVTLSGGQRARINLARAVYRDADIYLLDDPLSAVDTNVGRQLFNECIRGYLKGKTRILVTHQLQYLQNVDTIAVLKDGCIESQGIFESLTCSNPEFANLMNSFHVAEAGPEQDFESLILRRQSRQSIVSIAETIVSEPEAMNEEQMAKGRMPFRTYMQYFETGGNLCFRGLVLLTMILSQMATSGVDYWVAFWTNREVRKQNLNQTNHPSNFSRFEIASNVSAESKHQEDDGFFTPTTDIAIYAGIVSACILLTLIRGSLFIRLCKNASKVLHSRMYGTISQAKMKFFDTNPAGRILNRFSKDIGATDELLPKSMLEVITIMFMMSGSLIMIVVGNYYMIITAVAFSGLCFVVRNSYLSIAQCVNRLEGVARSPLLSHVSYSLDGLFTVRSSRAEERMIKQFDELQDIHTSASFINIATTHAFCFYINTLVTILTAFACFIFIVLDNEGTMSGDVGLAISQAIGLSEMVQFGMRKSVQIVSEMISTERVIEYTMIPREGPFESDEKNKPPSTWPQFGSISIRNVSLKYDEDKPPVLRNININISHGQKIGIVGRTGAGKSSLIAALFRLTKIGGSLKIDGIEIQTIGLSDLRSKISIIPQEPTLFKATLRQNLDPFQEYSDDYLWSALDEVELKESFTSLDYEVSQGGGNLSLGERQLICLARAILKNTKIVILDEATANVDSRTDALIQATIRRKFADRTVLTIAHRLSTIMDSDRVVVLDAGRVVEFDQPRILLQNPDGYFTRMVEGTSDKGKVIKTTKL